MSHSFKYHNRKMFDLVLDAALKLATKLMWPIFEEMDRKPPELVAGEVKVHPQVGKMMKEFGEGGWIGATFPTQYDGEQMPLLVAICCNMMFSAANYSASAFVGLGSGAARLITSFADDNLKETYVENILMGKWQGTMALTEPQAGSSLADICTMAESTGEDYYQVNSGCNCTTQWLLQAIAAQKAMQDDFSAAESNFYQGKYYTCRYFFGYELPKIMGLVKRLTDTDSLTVEMEAKFFAD